MNTELHTLTIADIGQRLRSGALTSTELTANMLARIKRYDHHLNAYTHVSEELALARAAKADADLARGMDHGPLHGIPYALKDIIDVKGLPTSCTSKLMVDYQPTDNATVEDKLRQGGGVLLGKLNTHEFALGGPSPDLPFPPARNPWDTRYFTGASSSGAGAAIAAGLAYVAIGSDTSGSIRGPANFCGTVGYKPTYGLVSRHRVFPLSFALDHVGPLTWSVKDAALALEVIAGHDPRDPASVQASPRPFSRWLEKEGLEQEEKAAHYRIAYPRHYLTEAPYAAETVIKAVDLAASLLAQSGAEIVESTMPDFQRFNACGRVIMAAESFMIHQQWIRERPLQFGRYTYQRVLPGAAVSAADLLQAHRARAALTGEFNHHTLRGFDGLLCPSSLALAPRLDEFPRDWPPAPHLTATRTIPFNVTGNPVANVPIAIDPNGLPLGVQIVGHLFMDHVVLQLAARLEAATGLLHQRPRLIREEPAGSERT